MSKKYGFAKERLLCSSRTADISTPFSGCTAGYSSRVKDHELELIESPHISVHFGETSATLDSLSSPTCPSLAHGSLLFEDEDWGLVLWRLSLPHSGKQI